MKLNEIIRNFYELNRTYFKQLLKERQIKKKASEHLVSNLYSKIHSDSSPCFVLSTGRSGTLLLNHVLNLHPFIESYHKPSPEFTWYSKWAYEQGVKEHSIRKAVVDAARYEVIRDSYLANRLFVETNNRITFFAPDLAKLFPKAKFIHLVREPYAFIRSGLSRNWYSDTHFYDEARVKPLYNNDIISKWEGFNASQKIAWLWNETNQFIEDFKGELDDQSRCLTLRSSDIFSDSKTYKSIFEFFGLKPVAYRSIKKLLKRPANKQKNTNATQIESPDSLYSLLKLKSFYGY